MKRIALAAMLGVLAFGPAYADTTVNYLHIESIPDEVKIMTDAVAQYEKDHPGIKINLEYLENEAFKAKLTTLLQSARNPNPSTRGRPPRNERNIPRLRAAFPVPGVVRGEPRLATVCMDSIAAMKQTAVSARRAGNSRRRSANNHRA